MPTPKKFTDEAIIAALHKTKGLVYLAADEVGCNPSTIFRRAKESPEVADALKRQRQRMVDLAEAKLYQLITQGNVTGILFYLKTQAKDRGYIERTEVVNIPADVKSLMDELEVTDPSQMWQALKASLEAVKARKNGQEVVN